jgi:peptidoglycan/xylan/chitin deacetylase (PgdA/CDA1 family)
MQMRRAILLVAMLISMLLGQPRPVQAQQDPSGDGYISISFHDIVDRREEMGFDSVTTSELIRFFEWLKGNGWTAISIDDIERAEKGGQPLPAKPILLTFDDGYASAYTRVYPLLQAYRYPAVIAVTGAWMTGAADGTVDYGDEQVPRTDFLTWDQVREMAASGLVEVASHTFNLHTGILANPQGNKIPAAATWAYDPVLHRYEDDAAHVSRVRDDLVKARGQLEAELGKAPRVLVWPFGRSSTLAADEARKVGFSHLLTLRPARSFLSEVGLTNRLYPTDRPQLGDLAGLLRFDAPVADTTRIACFSLAAMGRAASLDAAEIDLGHMIDFAHGVGANVVVLDVAGVPPIELAGQDVLSHAVWQMRTRAEAEVYLRVPDGTPPKIYADLLRRAKPDGLALPATAGLLAVDADMMPLPPTSGEDAERHRRRLDLATLDPESRAVMTAFDAAESIEPELKLMLIADHIPPPTRWPAPVADLLLLPAGTGDIQQTAAHLRAMGWLTPSQSGRVALTLSGHSADALAEATRAAQIEGGTALAICPADGALPWADEDVSTLSTVFSSLTLPRAP